MSRLREQGGQKMKARFTKDAIAAAALQLVDEAGLSALSMRSLAAALGTGPMTLYNYVADKEGLEELVVAAVVAEVRAPAPTDDWKHDAYAIAEAMWQGIRAHPAAIPLVLTRRTVSATGFAVADALIAALERAGLADRDRLAAFHAVLGFVVGAAQAELAGPFTRTAPQEKPRPASDRWQARSMPTSSRCRIAMQMSVEEDFDRGLQMLLDGIAARGTSKRRR